MHSQAGRSQVSVNKQTQTKIALQQKQNVELEQNK